MIVAARVAGMTFISGSNPREDALGMPIDRIKTFSLCGGKACDTTCTFVAFFLVFVSDT
jgi:hypothetical protein